MQNSPAEPGRSVFQSDQTFHIPLIIRDPTSEAEQNHDPDEFHDLAKDPSSLELVLEYAGKMSGWRMEHNDPALTDMHLSRNGVMQLCSCQLDQNALQRLKNRSHQWCILFRVNFFGEIGNA